jgi:hypothetical protein
MPGEASGSEGRQESGDRLFDDSLTTTRDFRPSLTVVERDVLELTAEPAGTSQIGPTLTALGSMVVPGGQPPTPAGGLP